MEEIQRVVTIDFLKYSHQLKKEDELKNVKERMEKCQGKDGGPIEERKIKGSQNYTNIPASAGGGCQTLGGTCKVPIHGSQPGH